MNILQNRKSIFYINFIFIFFVLFSYYCFDFFNVNVEIIRATFIFFVFLIGWWIASIAFFKKSYFFIFLFYISNFTFMYGRIVVCPADEVRGLFFAPYFFNTDTYMFMLKNLYYNLAGFVFGLLLIDFFSKPSITSKMLKVKENINDIKFSNIIFILLVISIAINIVLLIPKILILAEGGISSYDGYLEARAYNNLYLQIYMLIFPPLVLLNLSLNIPKNIKEKFLYLLLFNGLIAGIQGARGGFVISIFFYLWYRNYIFYEKIKTMKMVLIGIAIIFAVSILSSFRSNAEYLVGDFFDMLESIINEQGSSVALIGYYLDYPEIENNPHLIPFLLGVLNNLYLLLLDNETYNLNLIDANFAQFSSIIGQRIPAILNPYLYEQGSGTGGNYIIEEYDLLGYFGVFGLTGVYVYILYYLQNYFITSDKIFRKIFVLIFLDFSLFMPRTQYFTVGVTQILSIFIVCCVYFIGKKFISKFL